MAGRKSSGKEEKLHRGTPRRYHSSSVLRMPGGHSLVRDEGGEEVVSEAQQQLQTLLKKQLDTSVNTTKSLLQQPKRKEFTPAAIYKPLGQEVEGLYSLESYRNSEEGYERIDRLRHMGLTSQEIELHLSEEGLVEAETKRRKYGPDPVALEDRLRALHERIEEREKRLDEPVKYSGVRQMSRHAMEVERSLFRGATGGDALKHLTAQGSKRNSMSFPSQIMPDGKEWKSTTKGATRDLSRKQQAGKAGGTPPPEQQAGEVGGVSPLPLQVIERNRLTLAEILALPRFRGYSPGEPSKVLYVKNLHPKVSADDLSAIFGHLSQHPKIRMMTGRMRGQAFVEFETVDTAIKALEMVNGYLVRDKPLIICYGRGKTS